MSDERPQGLTEGSGRLGEPRRLDQMVSVRLDPKLVALLREFADKHDMSLSDVLREAALRLLMHESGQVMTFDISVTNETRPSSLSHESYRTEIAAAV